MSVMIHDVPEPLWQQFKAKAALEGVTVRDLFVRVLTNYIKNIRD